jgi:hypothetical protein
MLAREVLHWGGCALAALGVSLLCDGARAAPSCTRPQDAMAVRTAAVQQEMMVAALMCGSVSSYNRFVLSHQLELQESDKVLMDFFVQNDARTGFDDYNLFKTELANVSSFRSVNDRQFCRRANATFAVALSRNMPLAQLLLELPYSVETGSVSCPQSQYASQITPVTTPIANAVPKPRVRHRTWLGRLVDSIKAAVD